MAAIRALFEHGANEDRSMAVSNGKSRIVLGRRIPWPRPKTATDGSTQSLSRCKNLEVPARAVAEDRLVGRK